MHNSQKIKKNPPHRLQGNAGVRTLAVMMVVFMTLLSAVACEQHAHTKADEWSYDDEAHWHSATCEHVEEKFDYGKHEWNEFKYNGAAETESSICRVCGYSHTVPHTHTYGKWEYDTEEHWVRTTCRWHSSFTMRRGVHDWGDPSYEDWDGVGKVEVRTCKVCDLRRTTPVEEK